MLEASKEKAPISGGDVGVRIRQSDQGIGQCNEKRRHHALHDTGDG